MKYKSFFIISVLLSFNFSIYAEKKSNWYNELDKFYPSEKYIRAIGEDSTVHKAEMNAITKIAMNFKTSVDLQKSAVEELECVSENDKSIYSKSQSMEQIVSIESEAELFCLNFEEAIYDKKRKKYTTLAYINRSEASRKYESKISPLMIEIQNILNFGSEETEQLYNVLNFRKAYVLGELASLYINNAISINPTEIDKYAESLNIISNLKNEVIKQQKKVTFDINVKNISNNKNLNQLRDGLASIMEGDSFIRSNKNPLYTIQVEITFSEENYEAGVFVRPSVNVIIYNRNREVVESYSKVHDRYGHSNLENAYNLSLVRIQQDFDENFLVEYRGY